MHTEICATKQKLNACDMIISRDLLRDLGIVLDFSRKTIIWGDGEIPMKPRDSRAAPSLYIKEPNGFFEEVDHMSKILDAKYAKAELQSVGAKAKQLTTEQVEQLKNILKRHETLFEGALGRFKNTKYHILLKKDFRVLGIATFVFAHVQTCSHSVASKED